MAVPMLDLVAQHKTIREEVRAAIDEVLETQRCIGGPKVAECEKAIAEYSKCKRGIGASSGTDAILNALMSLGIGPGDEVITTPFTFFATATRRHVTMPPVAKRKGCRGPRDPNARHAACDQRGCGGLASVHHRRRRGAVGPL